jgi:aconitate hydratase
MGVLPLQFLPGDSVSSLGLTGEEVYAVTGLADAVAGGFKSGRALTVRARGPEGEKVFQAVARIDTPQEVLYYKHGGILQYVLRQLAGRK